MASFYKNKHNYKLTYSTVLKWKKKIVAQSNKSRGEMNGKDYPIQKTNDRKRDYFLRLLSSITKAKVTGSI